MGSILRCIECPSVGGDTIWSNMALAYERLPERVKTVCEGLYAMHDIAHSFGGDFTPARRRELGREFPAQEHPVVAVHPETGEKLLYVNQGFTTHFTNYTQKRERNIGADFAIEANKLMNYLFGQAAHPEFQVRLRWKPNTIAFWDNRSTQHYAVQDYFPATRRMMRVTIVGTPIRGVGDADRPAGEPPARRTGSRLTTERRRIQKESREETMNRRTIIAGAAAAGIGLAASRAVQAQQDALLTIVGPFGPGGLNDIVARMYVNKAAPLLKRTVIVGNKPGAGGLIAAQTVLRATRNRRCWWPAIHS